MHSKAARLSALCAFVLCAQTSQDPEVARAQAELAHTHYVVKEGVAAPVELEKAQQSVSEAEEHALLRRLFTVMTLPKRTPSKWWRLPRDGWSGGSRSWRKARSACSK